MANAAGEGRQADESVGIFEIEDKERWLMMGVFAGRVIIFPMELGQKVVSCPFFVKGHAVLPDGSLSVEVVSLGTSNSKESRTLTSMNKLLNKAHICQDDPCSVGGSYISHIKKLEVVHGPDLEQSSLGSSGFKRWANLCQEVLGVNVNETRAPEDPWKDDAMGARPGALRRGGERSGADSERHAIFVNDDPEDDEVVRGREKVKKVRSGAEATEPEEASRGRGRVTEALSDLRQKLKESMRTPGRPEPAGGGSADPKKAAASSLAVAPKKTDGPKNLTFGVEKPASEIQELLKSGLEEPREGTSSSKRNRSPSEALIAAASHAATGRTGGEEKKKKKKRKRSDNRVLQVLKNALRPRRGKKEKKKKRKKKEKSEGDPSDDDGSPDDSSDDEEEEEESSSYSSEEESSEDRKARRLQAPLKRRSQKKRGSVIHLLLEQIAEQLQDLSTPQEDLLTSGPKVGTYWQISLKHRYNAGHPALRELFLLATVIDRVRSGQLLEALDALAGRFIAVEAATHDGWNVAKHLEVAVPAEQAIAPAELQLAARRHNSMVLKAQGYEGKGKWRYASGGRGWSATGSSKDEGKGWWRSKGGKDGRDNKGKGGKWKGGKDAGRGKGKSKGEAEGDKTEE